MKDEKQERTFHTHGRTFTGKVVSNRMARTVIVVWGRRHYLPKYQRYERRFSKVKAHNPDNIDAKVGDIVTIKETKPLSKTKHFIVIRKEESEKNDKEVKKEGVKSTNKSVKVQTKKPVKNAVKKTVEKPTKEIKSTNSVKSKEGDL